MSRPYRVTPRLRGFKTYVATFRNASAKRVTRSLKTSDAHLAERICLDLMRLRGASVTTPSEVPPEISSVAAALYFDAKDFERQLEEVGVLHRAESEAMRLAARFPPNAFEQALALALSFVRVQGEAALLRDELGAAKRRLEESETARRQLERSVLGRMVIASRDIPPLSEALIQYERHLTATTTHNNARLHANLAREFTASLPDDISSLSDVTPEQIARFLDEKTRETNPSKPLARRRNLHIRLARLINWSARTWRYPSQMAEVRSVSGSRLQRERGDIVWHTQAELERAIEALPDDYWKALVASLGYAGLQLAELCWLRKQDVIIARDGKSGRFHITAVEDPSGARHALKTGARHREVDLEPKHLLPRIKKHLEAGGAGEVYLFAMPSSMRRRARGRTPGHAERWNTQTLSVRLRGHEGGKRRKPTPRLLPQGMNARTLRHTAGSLLLRAGRSEEEVAAYLGNTSAVVRSNYARILAREVNANLQS